MRRDLQSFCKFAAVGTANFEIATLRETENPELLVCLERQEKSITHRNHLREDKIEKKDGRWTIPRG